jgi:ribosomal-protein-alanine N-acetyltransferase
LPATRFPLPQVTDRLVLRPFAVEDAEAIYSIHGDPVASHFMGGTLTREQSCDNLCALIRRVDASGYGPFAVTLAGSDEAIGWAGIQQLPGEARLEILFALVPTYWRLGYATEASTRLLGIAFDNLGLREVFATVHPENQASIRVLTRLGFTPLGPYVHKLRQVEGVLYRVDGAEFASASAAKTGP